MNRTRLQAGLLAALCIFMFWWRLGHLGLIDPDEPFYAQTTREMVQANDWITPRIFGERQFEKPIGFYWQSMLAQKLFGDNEFAARVPSAVFASLLVFLTWWFGRRMFNPRAGFLAALVLGSGVEFIFMSRLMLTDISLAFFISASVFCLWLALQEEAHRTRWLILHLAASGCAVLIKGPLGLLVPLLGPVVYVLVAKTRWPWRGPGLWLGIAAWLLITVPWYATMFAKYGREYWDRFFVHENWERLFNSEHTHNNHWWYYLMILGVGSVPWIPLLIAAMGRTVLDARTDRRILYLGCWLATSLVFFTAASSKLPTYTFFLFVTVALLMGHTLDQWLTHGFRSPTERWTARLLALSQTLSLLVAASTVSLMVPADSKDFIRDLVPVAYLVAGVSLIPLVLMWLRNTAGWIAATTGLSLLLVVLLISVHSDKIENYTCTRHIVEKVAAVRRPNEPIVTSSFLARAITYYHGKQPDGVFFYPTPRRPTQPYFTPHPPLHFLLGDPGVRDFARQHSSILVIGMARDMLRLNGTNSAVAGWCEPLARNGDRVLFRVQSDRPRP